MKFIFAALLFSVLANSANAATQAYFTSDKTTIAVQGASADLDAMNLFTTLNIVPTDESKSIQKKFRLTSADGELLLDLQCDLSKTDQNAGSCAVKI
jgi:hypothetical protein